MMDGAAKKKSDFEDPEAGKKKLKKNQDTETLASKGVIKTGPLPVKSVAQSENTVDFYIDNFSICVRGTNVISNATLDIKAGRRYGLVGPKGHGKTLLIRHIANRSLSIPANIDIFLSNEVFPDQNSALDAVLNCDSKRENLLKDLRKLEEAFNEPDRIIEIYEELKKIGGHSYEDRARRILAGLGFSREKQDRATETFSGDWLKRICLAKALYMEPTLLLLDDPTEYLDLYAVDYLEKYLRGCTNTLIVASNDASFLDNVCTDIIHLKNKKIFNYSGNYKDFKIDIEKRNEKSN